MLQPLSSSTPTGGGLAPGEIAGVVTGLLLLLIVIAFLILLAVIVHHRLKKKKQKHLKKDNCDPQLGGNYRPFAGGILGQSYEDPEQFSDKKMTSRMSYRERFQKRMVCKILYFHCMTLFLHINFTPSILKAMHIQLLVQLRKITKGI